MKKQGLFIVVLLMAVCHIGHVHGQLTLATDNFKTTVDHQGGLLCDEVTDLGIQIPIDETFNKYDRVEVVLEGYRDWLNLRKREFYYYPQSKGFKDDQENMAFLNVYLVNSKASPRESLVPLSDICGTDKQDSELKVVVYGRYESGSEEHWDEQLESFVRNKVYDRGREIFSTATFYFKQSEKQLAHAAVVKKEEAVFGKVYEAYSNVSPPPVGKEFWNGGKKNIYKAYKTVRKAMRREGDYDGMMELGEKVLAMRNAKKTRPLVSAILEVGTAGDRSKLEKLLMDF